MNYFNNISYTICHIFLMLFIYFFVTHRYSRRKTMAICVTSFLILTLTDLLKLNLFSESDLCYVSVTILQIIVTQSTGLLISRTRDHRVLFMSLSASNYVIAGSIGTTILYICTENALLALAGGFLIHSALLLFLYFRIREICLRAYERKPLKGIWELCLVPVFFYCGFCFLAFFPHTLYDNPDNIPGVILFLITMFVSYVTVLRYAESESENSGIYLKNILFESYIKGLESQYYQVEQSERNLKILRHDMRHYSKMIDSLLAQEAYDEIAKITAHISKVSDDNKVERYCENLIIHSILSEMMKKADAANITIHFDVTVPRELPVNDYEFAAVIANLLENALNCVKNSKKKERYIKVKLHCALDHLLIQMENVCEQEVLFDSLTGLPKSQKQKEHGLGMQSVSAFAEKAGGSINCFCENGIFHITFFAKF